MNDHRYTVPSRQEREEDLERMATEGPSDQITNLYLKFVEEEIPASRKTKIIGIYSVHSLRKLGEIRWWSPWRQYTFFPAHATVLNIDCMKTVIAKINELMAERK